MPFTVRLSPYLEAQARSRADLLGISLNSLISVALDLHLRSSCAAADEQLQVSPSTPTLATTPKTELPPLPKAPALIPERRILESRPVVKSSPSPPNDPKPVLPNNPTKRDRQLLSQWHLRNPKKK